MSATEPSAGSPQGRGVRPAPPSAGDPAVTISDLTVTYGSVTAVDGLSLTLPSGAVSVVLGPNGAGKTTTLEVCEGLCRPDSGDVRVLGTNPWRADANHRARVGVMLQRAGLPSGISAMEALRSAADLYAHPYPVDALAERLRLNELARRPFRRLSGGEQQRVGLAVALVGRPDLLLLDEPTTGLDPVTRRDTWDLLVEVANQGCAVVVTTHQIDEAEAVADHVVLVAAGRTVVQDSPSALTAGPTEVRFEANPGLHVDVPEAISVAEPTAGHYVVTGRDQVTDSQLMSAVLEWCRSANVTPSTMSSGSRTLEDVVLTLVDWQDTQRHGGESR